MSASTDVGYCDTEDVRELLQETTASFGSNELDTAFVEAAVLGESEWVQEETNRHWYDPSAGASDLETDSPLTHDEDVQDIPSSPHADNAQLHHHGGAGRADIRYPQRSSGPYARVRLQRRDVTTLSELLVRQSDGSFEDWVGASDKQQGRGEDYYLQVDDSTGQTDLYLHTGALPPLADYDDAVIATYDYGIDEIPKTVRQAVAALAGASLLRDDAATTAIPDNGQLVNLDTKADALETRGKRLLSIHR